MSIVASAVAGPRVSMYMVRLGGASLMRTMRRPRWVAEPRAAVSGAMDQKPGIVRYLLHQDEVVGHGGLAGGPEPVVVPQLVLVACLEVDRECPVEFGGCDPIVVGRVLGADEDEGVLEDRYGAHEFGVARVCHEGGVHRARLHGVVGLRGVKRAHGELLGEAAGEEVGKGAGHHVGAEGLDGPGLEGSHAAAPHHLACFCPEPLPFLRKRYHGAPRGGEGHGALPLVAFHEPAAELRLKGVEPP